MSESGPIARTENPLRPEAYTELVGRLTVFRHGETEYTDQYPDLSGKGRSTLTEAGRQLRSEIDEESEDLLFVHSPNVRAKGSMAYLLHGMELIDDVEEAKVEGVARPFKPLRSVKKLDPEAASEMVFRYTGTREPTAGHYEEFDRMYTLSDEFETSPHWEPRSNAPKRANRLLRYALAILLKNHKESESPKTPRIVAVTHFEMINHIAVKLFGLDLEKDSLYARGEAITFDVRANPDEDQRLLLMCSFRGEKRNAWFDFTKGEVTEVE